MKSINRVRPRAEHVAAPPRRLCITAHGVPIEICASEAPILERIEAGLPEGSRRTRRTRDAASYAFWKHPSQARYGLTIDGAWLAGPALLDDVLAVFEPHLIMRIAERAPHHTFVHAGVVRFHGRGIMLPGYSFAGKTTLVAELVRAGALYYSDEYALLDRDGFAHPYPRPLQMRKPGERTQTSIPVGEIGGVAGSEPIAIDLVAFCTYKKGGRFRPRTVTPGRAALEMLQYTMSARHAPEAALGALQRVVTGAALIKGTRGETSQVIDFLAKRFPA